MSTVGEVISCINDFAELSYQESYDNSGLQIGSAASVVKGVLLTLDITEEIIDEAVSLNVNLIISHHPLIFKGIKNLSSDNYLNRAVVKALKHDISIFCCHTNIDNISRGVNFKIAEKLGLQNIRILKPIDGDLFKLVCFVPVDHAEVIRKAILESGAGHIGNYDYCSFNCQGNGTFRASENSNPFKGKINEIHTEPEVRIETIFPKFLEKKIIPAMIKAHPYEEVAYDIYPLVNNNSSVGSGAIGYFNDPLAEIDFLHLLKQTFGIPVIRHSKLTGLPLSCVALCGGSGSFLLADAISSGAGAFITSDLKYHQFFDADKKLILADIGHFESEQFTVEIFYDLLIKNFSNFAIYFTKVKTNPINYL